MSKRWLLINPPTGEYIRDTRCQASVNDAIAVVERAPVDLAYIAGEISENGHKCFLRDYPAEKMDWDDLIWDIKYYKINYIVINTTMFTYVDDLKVCGMCKKIDANIITIGKGAVFFHEPEKIMKQFPDLDIAVARDEERVFGEISSSPDNYDAIENIIYRKNGVIVTNPKHISSSFQLKPPQIDLINHRLYKRPDTGQMQATIVVGRGCSGKCIYCVAPLIGGNIVRYRSISQILSEIKLYYSKYGIDNFYFSADNFTFDHKWVLQFCQEINKLEFKISWLCTARADSISEDLISAIKQAGCWGVSIGVESGSEKIQKLIKKNLTKSKIMKAVSICKKYEMITLLHFMIGFPWEKAIHVEATIKLAKKLKGNIMEFYVVTPFPGTKLYNIIQDNRNLMVIKNILYTNQTKPTLNTFYLTAEEIDKLRKKAIRTIYTNPFFYFNELKYIHSFRQLKCCIKFFCRKVFRIIISCRR